MAMWAWRFWLMKLIYFHKMIALMIKQYQAKWIILCGRLKKSWRVSVMSGSTELICLYHIHILIYCAHDLILLWNYFSFEICFLWLKFPSLLKYVPSLLWLTVGSPVNTASTVSSQASCSVRFCGLLFDCNSHCWSQRSWNLLSYNLSSTSFGMTS